MTIEPTRRRVLLGIAAASAAAAGTAAKASQSPQELPKLIAMGDALPEIEAIYWRARERTRLVLTAVAPVWPEAPEEIRMWSGDSKPETDISGAGIERPWSKDGKVRRVMHYGTPEAIQDGIKQERARIAHIMKTKSKRGLKYHRTQMERYEKALPLSCWYVAEIERIRATSGYSEAKTAETAAKEALKEHVGEIMSTEPRGMEGVVVQAQALAAWQAIGSVAAMDFETVEWSGKLAEAILQKATSRTTTR